MIEELKKLGLENYHAKALDILLKEKLDLRELSKKAEIPFGKIYTIIKELKKEGLIKETPSRPKKVYVDNASLVISRLIEAKEKKDSELINRIRKISSDIDIERDRESRFFEVGTGLEDNKKIQMRCFNEAEEEVCQILNIYHKPKTNRKNKTLWENAIVDAVNRGVVFRAVYPKKTVLPEILEKLSTDNPDMFQVRRIDTDFIRCDIIDSKKVLIKIVWEDPILFGGVIFIENKELAENLKNIFEEIWERGE